MKTIVITGVSRGIGRALAIKFLEEGWRVLGTSQSGSVDYSNDRLEIFKLDLADTASIEKCCDAMRDRGGHIDALINNAGTLEDEDETRVIVDKLRKTLEVNLIGTIGFTERILAMMAKEARILNISSAAGSLNDDPEESHFPYHYPAYKISKAALNMYTRTLSGRLKNEGSQITVSSVHPGWVKTDMGGEEAPLEPAEAASDIYDLLISGPESGQFWYKSRKYPW